LTSIPPVASATAPGLVRRRRAVVAGGAGFLGSHLCERLLAEGIEMLCLDNFVTGTPDNVAHLVSNDCFRLVRCDVTDFIHVTGEVDYVRRAIHSCRWALAHQTFSG
jgi:nucleoside-diphosphate-sugar epimerase